MKRTSIAISAAALVLTACGGSDPTSGVDSLAAQVVNGTAATGAPMPSAMINATCGSASGTATTASDGTYSVKVTGGSLPCVLTATSSDGTTVLHSLVAGTGTSSSAAVAQITPLTELLVAQLAAGDPAKFVSSFSSNTTISVDAVAAANTTVLAALKAAGLDVSAITNVATGTISVGSGGNSYDGVLDTLQKAITGANTTLAELVTAISTTASSGTAQGAVMGTVLAPVATSSCPSLKGGTHRVIDFTDSTTYTATVDVTHLTVSANGNNYTLTKNATCDYTLNDTSHTRVLVAKSGMAVWMNGGGTAPSPGAAGTVGVSFPAQTLDTTALGGVYDRVTYGAASATPFGAFGTATFDGAGVNTTSINCTNGVGSCAPDPSPSPLGHVVSTSDGGVDYLNADGSLGAHAFGFRNAQGQTVLIAYESSGSVSVLSKQSTLSLPTVGATTSFWQSKLTPTATPLLVMADDSNTVTAVDSATSLVTRKFQDNHTDQLTFNSPFAGARYRALNACTTTAGAAGTCAPVVQLPLQGEGINLAISANPSNPFLTVSISKP